MYRPRGVKKYKFRFGITIIKYTRAVVRILFSAMADRYYNATKERVYTRMYMIKCKETTRGRRRVTFERVAATAGREGGHLPLPPFRPTLPAVPYSSSARRSILAAVLPSAGKFVNANTRPWYKCPLNIFIYS